MAPRLPQRHAVRSRMPAVPVAVLCPRDTHRIFSVEQLTPCHTSSLVVTNPGTISTCHVHVQVFYSTLCIIPPTISIHTDGACCVVLSCSLTQPLHRSDLHAGKTWFQFLRACETSLVDCLGQSFANMAFQENVLCTGDAAMRCRTKAWAMCPAQEPPRMVPDALSLYHLTCALGAWGTSLAHTSWRSVKKRARRVFTHEQTT